MVAMTRTAVAPETVVLTDTLQGLRPPRRRAFAGFNRCAWFVLLYFAPTSCGMHAVTTQFYEAAGYRFSNAERHQIQTIADATAVEVRRLLPALPGQLVLRVQPSKSVIPETGETAYAVLPNSVGWLVDPDHPGSVTATIARELRATLYHEFHHLVRYAYVGEGKSVMDGVVTEGMATVFERDAAGASPPWGAYPKDAMNWLIELGSLPPDADVRYWLTQRHPDGRRWIGMRAGTYLVDQAMRLTGQSSADLVAKSTEEIVRMSLQR